MVSCEFKEDGKIEIALLGDSDTMLEETLRIASVAGFLVTSINGGKTEVARFVERFTEELKDGIMALYDKENEDIGRELLSGMEIEEKIWQ